MCLYRMRERIFSACGKCIVPLKMPHHAALLLLVLFLGTSGVSGVSGDEEDICGIFEDGKLDHNVEHMMVLSPSPVHVIVSCGSGHLLVPADETKLFCNDSTGWDYDAVHCEKIPSVGFAVSRTTHNIEDPKLYLRVQLDGKLVREFTVTMTLSNSTGHVIPDGERFSLQDKPLTFTDEDTEKTLTVKVVDTKVSAENEIYTVCLNVVKEGGEVRANVTELRRCVDVTVNNTNVAAVTLINKHPIFTAGTQNLVFQIGYRQGIISLNLCLTLLDGQESDKERCQNLSIPEKVDIYVANLLENDKDSLFSQFDVGIYTVELSSYTKGCSASITTPTFEVEFTAPALELRNGITTVKLAESVYKVHVDVGNVLSSDLIEVTFLDEKFAIPITYTITPRESGSAKGYSSSAVVDPGDPNIHIDDLIKKSITITDKQEETFTVSITVQTSRYIAMVMKGGDTAELNLIFDVTLAFALPQYHQWDNKDVRVTLLTSRCLNISDYVQFTAIDGFDFFAPLNEYVKIGDEKEWAMTLEAVTFPTLGVYSLAMGKKGDAPSLIITQEQVNFTVGTELGFSAKSYKYDEGLTIIITSTRVQIGFKLNKLVSLNCDPKDALTLNVDVDSDKGIFAVVVKKDETIGNVNISVSLSVVKGMEELVRLSNSINVTMVIIPPVEVPTSVTPVEESNDNNGSEDDGSIDVAVETSWSFGGMIAVLIGAVVVVVVAYVGYSNRQKIMTLVGVGGGGEGGGGGRDIISKARKRLRSRGAYKKLPTSVQDAMTRHND